MKFKLDVEKAESLYRQVNGARVDVVQSHYDVEPSTVNPHEFLSLLDDHKKSSLWFESKPSFYRLVSFFEDLDGTPISIYHPNYKAFTDSLVNTFSSQFIHGRSFCLPGEMPDFSMQLSNHPCFRAYPLQVTMGGQVGKSWNNDPFEVSVIDDYLDLMLEKVIPDNFVFPKDSNVGAPSLSKNPSTKRFILETAVRNFDDISELLDDESSRVLSMSNEKRFELLYHGYNISCIATQGLRIQNDKHGSSGKTRKFFQYNNEMETVVDITDIPGTFARRTRVVIGLNYGVNCLTNLMLAPIRNFYYDRFFHTYKVIDQSQLNDEFKSVNFIFGVDVTQLDNNTSGDRVDYYCSKLISVVSQKYHKMYKKLFFMSTHPAIFFRPSSYSLGFYCDGNPKAVSFDELKDNVSVGIPSGISATSELGKIEVTSYFLIQIKLVHEQFDQLIEDDEIFAAFKSFISSNVQSGGINISIAQIKSIDPFQDPVSNYSNFKDFIFNFLNNHCNGEFVIKNTGDDTVLGCHAKYLYFFFCLMLLVRKHNDNPSSNLFSNLPVIKYKSCNWHKIDAEEPLSYLGNLLYKIGNRWEFKYNPSSFIINTLLPEADINHGKKSRTWGLGYLARCDVYRQNEFMDDIIHRFESEFSKYFRTDSCSNIAKQHMAKYSQLNDVNFSLADQIFIDNPDSIYYKIDVKDLSPGIFETQFSYLPLNNMIKFYRDLFKSEKLILPEE